MGGGDSIHGNEDYEKQAKSSLVHNWMHKVTSWRP
jgi:hypothetical protein